MITYKIDYNLHILFVGSNPHPGSYRRGVPFSNNKMLWYLLSDAGIIPEPRHCLSDDAYLKRVYEHAFTAQYRLGIVDILHIPTRTALEAKKFDMRERRREIRAYIHQYQPSVVCFVSKATYNMFTGVSKGVSYGWQSFLAASRLYVMHAPHRGWAHVRVHELQEIKRHIPHAF